MTKHTCLCLQCGRDFDIVLPEGRDLSRQSCPICGGANVVEYNPRDFFSRLFGYTGGG